MKTVEILDIENQLIKMKSQLVESLDSLLKDKSRQGEGLTQDMDDQSVIIENDQVVDDLDELKTNKLRSVNHALFRIKAGEYGTCEVCNEEIDPKRLKAIPYTNKCISCSENERVL